MDLIVFDSILLLSISTPSYLASCENSSYLTRTFIFYDVHIVYLLYYLCFIVMYCELVSVSVRNFLISKWCRISENKKSLHGFWDFTFASPFSDYRPLHFADSSQKCQYEFASMRREINILIFRDKVYIVLFQKLYKFQKIGSFSKEPIYFPDEQSIYFSCEYIHFESRKCRAFTHFTCSRYSLISVGKIFTCSPPLIVIGLYIGSEYPILAIESVSFVYLLGSGYSHIEGYPLCLLFFSGWGESMSHIDLWELGEEWIYDES